MKKLMVVLTCGLLVMSLFACSSNEIVNVNTEEVIVSSPEVNSVPIDEEVLIKHNFISGDQALDVLAAEDDYTSKLSIFDYNSKFQSETVLDEAGRRAVLEDHVLEWNESQKKSVDQAMENINEKFKDFDIDMPDITFILTADKDEGGAAYTRGKSIILKSHSVYKHTLDLEHLIVHEMFHVYSRAHKDLRPQMYAVIGYKPCQELIWPDELVDLKISNPDAPDNNFYISGTHKDMVYDFMPIIYSSEPYVVGSKTSFFRTLQDKFLAVEIVEGVANPIYVEYELLIVSKNSIDEFYEKIGRNTDYTYHPEETMADNFVFMIYQSDVKSPFVVEGLKAVINSKN
ncbi:hypothetical protein EZV73_18445 [Acidaminobacter sp. JC074]|uniref:hypothetical protein n=1 Tax=Acidaminobacter sp. JC074 TaxID=2530199 RepID=UPI001F0EC43C|nr:hypothetical protein [Acidaminobacter sp. JC074]MCH4889568.1 hypothetical protein [Acidaminobacter sp. JC074]